MKFAIFGNCFLEHKAKYMQRLLDVLSSQGTEFIIRQDFYEFLKRTVKISGRSEQVFADKTFTADMALSVGGDGTFLDTAQWVGNKNIPILGINTGRLGFLADISPDNLEVTMRGIFRGEYTVENRSVLQVSLSEGTLSGSPFGLNEVAVLKHDSSSMISIRTSIDGEFLTNYRADGLIIATPTGSTAYSLSVGGPILSPSSHTFCVSPVAPHSLNMRPIVITDDQTIRLEVESRSRNFLLSVDGRSESIHQGVTLCVRRAPYDVKLVKRPHHEFFETLRNKMMWGADNR
ncbi:MAG: NAD kinase [Bacteroidales bacterium]|nr:NAD kinase [Bacteroidales bacterium]